MDGRRNALLLGLTLGFLVGSRGEYVGAPDNYFSHCSYHGHLNLEDHSCICVSGWTGPDCSLRTCPVGRAWFDYPSDDHVAHADTECSNMGYCDRQRGECQCRDGFHGPACQYISCPEVKGKVCNGHGRCLSMRDAAAGWDGLHLTRPEASYDDIWDADQLLGCVCDAGFTGYDCGLQECPRGDDPRTTGQQNEQLKIVCQADGGFWHLTFRGETSERIPHDAGHGVVKSALEGMKSIGSVSVAFANYADGACGASSANTITVEFLSEFGDLPAARVDGSLTLSSSSPTLHILSQYTFQCDAGVSSGSVFLEYDGSLSTRIAYDASESDVSTAVSNIPYLARHHAFGNVTVTVDMGNSQLCSSGGSCSTTISIASPYGNLPMMDVVSSLRYADGSYGNFTWSSLKGTKENAVCSNHGFCDYDTGTCFCDQRFVGSSAVHMYKWSSSDGYGRKGTRGDCGYEVEPAIQCPVGKNNELCSGQGRCIDATKTCECFDGFFGTSCELRSCPTGISWFEEATRKNSAHSVAPCSNRGRCNHATGKCDCDPRFSGPACQFMYCATSVPGEDCSGHGRCLPMWRLAQLADVNGEDAQLKYGLSDESLNPSHTWDRDVVFGCHCDSKDDKQPATGPIGKVSGIEVANPRLGGWTGYDCSRRWCPTGDDPYTEGVYETQTIYCDQTSGDFTVSFRRDTSAPIAHDATAADIETALEAMTTISDVHVEFVDSATTACVTNAGSGSGGFQVQFLGELGDVPTLTTSPSYIVIETTKGTRENVECSNHGICDYQTGSCQCLPGFSGSAGNNSEGTRRDCGYLNPFGLTLNPFYGA